MKRKLIFLIGASGSGKDTAADYLCDTYGFHKVASYTTRQRRPGEENGREHTFLHWGEVAHSPETWLEHRGLHLLAKTVYGGHYYFTAMEQLTHREAYKPKRKKKAVLLSDSSDSHTLHDAHLIPLHPHTPVIYIIDEAGLVEMMGDTTRKNWLTDNFDFELWHIARCGSISDTKRTQRDANRTALPDDAYDIHIHNIYDIDYLYSVLDSIHAKMHVTQ